MNKYNNSVFRVVFESRDQFRVIDETNQIYKAEVSGNFRKSSLLWPAVGDRVRGLLYPAAQGEQLLIEEVLPRSSVLKRKDSSDFGEQILAANVDLAFIVTSANEDLNFKRIDRYLTIVENSGIKPVIIVNKIELVENAQAMTDELIHRYNQVDVIAVSVFENINLDKLDGYLQNFKTLTFLGSSGVGKSSLTNYFLRESKMKTSGIRESDGRGRHTTTHRELMMTSDQVAIIDTPGLRSIGLTEDSAAASVFGEIVELQSQCRFGDCTHSHEPGCAVKSEIEKGELNEDVWQSYVKTQREINHLKRKSDKALQSAEKKKWAKISKSLRARNKIL